jgi:RNA recognition motif-containing protein
MPDGDSHLHLAWFRLFVGDLSNDVSDDVLANAFNKYTSFQKARVIRDRLSGKVCRMHYLSFLQRY